MKADSPHHGLSIMLRTLKLPTFAAMHEQIALRGDREGWTLGQSLRHLCELEIEERRTRKIVRLLKAADLPSDKTVATLDAKRWSTKNDAVSFRITPKRGQSSVCLGSTRKPSHRSR